MLHSVLKCNFGAQELCLRTPTLSWGPYHFVMVPLKLYWEFGNAYDTMKILSQL